MLEPPPGPTAKTMMFPLPAMPPNGTMTTTGLLPGVAVPSAIGCPVGFVVTNDNEVPAGIAAGSNAITAFVPEMNPGMAFVGVEA